MGFIDEVRSAQSENFIESVDMDIAVEDAYQRLIQEQVNKIKKEIIALAKSEATKGIKSSYIRGRYNLNLQLADLPMGRGCKCGKYKYGTVYQEYEGTGLYIKFDAISTFRQDRSIFDTWKGWVSITEFGKKFYEDLRVACSKENITLEYPRVFLKTHPSYLGKNIPFPKDGIQVDEKFKSNNAFDGGNLFTEFCFKV